MDDKEWQAANGYREGEKNKYNEDFDLLTIAKKYINLDNDAEESEKAIVKKELLEALEKSSGLSTAYVLDYVLSRKKNCEELEKLLYIKYGSEKPKTEVFDSSKSRISSK